MRHTILHADVMDGLRSLPDRSVHCIITSPPYWGLRDYGIEGQIGIEPSPEEYVQKIVAVFREARRVLRDEGTMWLNLGDCYARSRSAWGLKAKDLVGMPWRIAFALQADGWYLRSDIVWAKPNPMPESVRDRPTKSHEFVFLFAKRARYFYDADAVREVAAYPNDDRGARADARREIPGANRMTGKTGTHRNRRDVWRIATQATPDAHFATFPEALVEPCIKAGTSERGCCPSCGAPWRRMVEISPGGLPRRDTEAWNSGGPLTPHKGYRGSPIVTQMGWQPSCTCGAEETVPCVVLDPFGGSGTVAKVARGLGRSSVMIELNPAYVEIMKKRLRCGGQLDSDVNEIHVTSLPLADGGVA